MAEIKYNSSSKTLSMVYISLFVALIAVCSWISVPTAVPFTLQTFAVFLTVGLLGGKRGTAAVTVYLLLGFLGLPVFAGFRSGFGVMLGPDGGFLLGFVLTALVMWLCLRLFGNGTVALVFAMLFGLLVCYVLGTIWFVAVYAGGTGEAGILTALTACVFPFVIPDIVKIAVAVIVCKRLGKYVKS